MNEQEQKETLRFRTALQLISYLNDIPEVSNSPELFPLVLKNDGIVENVKDLKKWFEERVFLPDGIIIKAFEIEKTDKETEEKTITRLDRVIDLSYQDKQFRIDLISFHRLIIDAIREKKSKLDIEEKLDAFIKEREELIPLLEETDIDSLSDKEDLEARLNEYHLFRLRGSKKLHEDFGIFLAKRKNVKKNDLTEKIKQSPIELRYYDFAFEESRKPRTSDKFMEFAAKYLIDFNITPKWKWLCETFDVQEEKRKVRENGRTVEKTVAVNKRILRFSEKIPDGYRLAIMDGQVMVRYNDKENYRFLIGHRAMKNIIIAHEENKDVNSFFENIVKDLDQIQNANESTSFDDLEILTKNELPDSWKMKLSKPAPSDEIRKTMIKKAGKRIDKIVEILEPFTKDELPRISRAEKNRQIMRCYKYFEWNYPQQSENKFLRKDEYQSMSQFHYLLEKMKQGKDKMNDRKYKGLLDGIINHMPEDVKCLLIVSSNINELLRNTAKMTIDFLKSRKNVLTQVKGERFREIIAKIGLSYSYDKSTIASHIPFSIHPILPVRLYYDNNGIENLSLSKKIRNDPKYKSALESSFYNYQSYIDYYLDKTLHKKIMRKLIGRIDDQHTKDGLMWWMAKKYLDETNQAIKDFLTNSNIRDADFKISSIRKSDIPIDIDNKDVGKVRLDLKFHQFDDLHFIRDEKETSRIVNYLIKELGENYANTTEGITKLSDDESRKQKCKWIIRYDEILKQQKRIYHQSLHWAKHILAWEYNIIKKYTKQNKTAIANNEDMEYIDFPTIIKKSEASEDIGKSLIKIRNKAFHSNIPEGWTYREKEEDEELCELIGYKKKEKKDYEKKD